MEAFFRCKFFIKEMRIILGKITIEICKNVQVENPHFVLELLLTFLPQKLHLYSVFGLRVDEVVQLVNSEFLRQSGAFTGMGLARKG